MLPNETTCPKSVSKCSPSSTTPKPSSIPISSPRRIGPIVSPQFSPPEDASPPSPVKSNPWASANLPPLASQQVPLLQNRIVHLTAILDRVRTDLERKQVVHDRDMRFVRNLLYTLNVKGYTSITDQNGMVVDLANCKGEYLLEMKGGCRSVDDSSQQKPRVKRIWGNEFYYKAIIGNQEKAIQTLAQQLAETHAKNLVIPPKEEESPPTRVTVSSMTNPSPSESSDLAEITTLLETTCSRHPDVFYALRNSHEVGPQDETGGGGEKEDNKSSPKSPRTISLSESGIVEKILDRCKSRIPVVVKCGSSDSTQVGETTTTTDWSNCGGEEGDIGVSPRPSFTTPTPPAPPPKSGNVSSSSDDSSGPNGPTASSPSSIELLDFEKFIGAAVLQLRGQRTISIQQPTTPPRSISAGGKVCSSGEQDGGEDVTITTGRKSPRNSDPDNLNIPLKKKNRNISKSAKIDAKLLRTNQPIASTGPQNRLCLLLPTIQPSDNNKVVTTKSTSGGSLENCENIKALFPIPTLVPTTTKRTTKTRPRSDNASSGSGRTTRSQPAANSSNNNRPISPLGNTIMFATAITPIPQQQCRPKEKSSSSPILAVLSPSPRGGGGGHPSPIVTTRPVVNKKQQMRCKSSYNNRPSDRLSPLPLATRSQDDGIAIYSSYQLTAQRPRSADGGGVDLTTRPGMSCPYCLQEFDKNMSPMEVRTHLEKHVAQR